MDVQDARKEDEIIFLMALVPGPTQPDLTRIAKTISTSRFQLIQEVFTLELMSRLHTTSNWGVIGLLVKVSR
jgi:hypothetical protein